MPMIDVYASAGTFVDPSGLASKLAATLMEVEGVPPIPLFKQNTDTSVHETTVANVIGGSNYVRLQVLTNQGALDRLTDVVAEAAGDPSIAERTWVLLT
jgi:hypothetical protein